MTGQGGVGSLAALAYTAAVFLSGVWLGVRATLQWVAR